MELTPFGTASLGGLIDALKPFNGESVVECDFAGFVPDLESIGSWRGVYAHLAIGFEQTHWINRPTVAALRTALEAVVGNTYEGYKGGSYRMDRDTPIWMDNRGQATSTAIVGVEFVGHKAILQTAKVDF